MQSLMVILAGALVLQGTPQLPSPEAVLAAVAARGAKAVVKEIWSDPAATHALLSGVAAGERKWLRAALAIQSGTDAGSAEDLDGAFADGLLAAPAVLLPALSNPWWKTRAFSVCEFDWDAELPGGVAAYATRLETAVRRDKTLATQLRAQCEAGIAKTRERTRRHEVEGTRRPTSG